MIQNNQIVVRQSGAVRIFSVSDAPDGHLFVAEAMRHIPFGIRRVYFITDLGNGRAVRGKHAHRKLEQVIFCIRGAFSLELDDAVTKQTIRMTKPSEGILLGTMLWHSMTDFTPDCLILVLASALYDEADYIRDYPKFLEETGH